MTVGSGQEYVEGWRYQDPGPDNPTAPPPQHDPGGGVRRGVHRNDDNHDERWRRWRLVRRRGRIGRNGSDHRAHHAPNQPRGLARWSCATARDGPMHVATTTTPSEVLGSRRSTSFR